ncbi:GNAT family N-acetyltransferase [soil metagenome]
MLIIRKARQDEDTSDIRGILDVHYAAVHGEPVDYYDEEILDDWSPDVTDSRVDNFVNRHQRQDEVIRVAEMDSAVVGFGILVPRLSEIRACYVHPRLSRQGIGVALLNELERLAGQSGLDWLNLNAALNAEAFYLANGYIADGLGKQMLPSGREMSCVRMYKFLVSETSKWSRGLVP